MPDNAQESALEAPESVELPTPQISQPSRGPATSAERPDEAQLVERLAEKLAPKIQEYISRSVQSTKDRRFDGFARQMAEVQEYLKASGGDPRKAAREYALDQMLNQPQSSPQDAGTSVEAEIREGARRVLKAAEEEWGVKLTRDELPDEGAVYESVADYHADLARRVARKAKQSRGGATTVAVEGGQRAQTGDNADELAAKLQQAIATGKGLDEIKVLRDALQEAISRT